MTKKLKVPRGSMRALRRKNMARFAAERKARLAALTGTIRVNAPSLNMLSQHIAKVRS